MDSFDRLFRPEEIAINNFDLAKPIVPQLEVFAKDNQIILELGWKVEISKKVKQKFSGDISDELTGKWEALFNAIQSAN